MIFSIVIPVYNVESYLEKCIDSVINQNYSNLQIILVDDGSTDKSGIICDKYALLDNRIEVIHQKNGGLSTARNSGLASATGDFIWFIDSDDWIEKNAIEILTKKIQDNCSIEMIGFSVIDYLENNNTFFQENNLYAIKSTNGSDYVMQNKIFYAPVWSYVYSLSFLKLNNFTFEPNIIYEDDYFNLICFSKVGKIMKIPFSLYFYRRRLNSITSSKITIKNIISVSKIIDLCVSIYSSSNMPDYVKHMMFGYSKQLLLFFNEVKTDHELKNTIFEKINNVKHRNRYFKSDFFYITFEKFIYNLDVKFLYFYLSNMKIIQYLMKSFHYHIIRRFSKNQ